MTISCQLIAVGKNKDAAIAQLMQDYTKRLSWGWSMVEIAPPNCSDAERKSREAELIRKSIPPKACVIALDERGVVVDSVAFADKLQQLAEHVSMQLVFIIGGADGLADDLRASAHWCVAFGKLTWPHMLVRVLLAEQIYRASTILGGHPYHRV